MPTRILVVDDSPTIRSVVSMILERNGYDPKVASDGEDAYRALASGEVKADLVLVDFVMPHMNGYQFCRALRDNAELAQTPVVLMSAKGDRIRDQFVEQTGALDAITKPFDAQALVAVIENALRRVNSGRASSHRVNDLVEEVSAPGGSERLSAPGVAPSAPPSRIGLPFGEFETRRTHIAQIVGQKLGSLTAEMLAARPDLAGPNTSPKALGAAIAERLSNEAIVEMMEAFRPARDRDTLLAGDFGVVPIGAILQLLQSENQTGVLVCTLGPGDANSAEVRATFRGGLIDLVQSTGAGDEFRLGRFFVEEEWLTEAEIDAFMQRLAGTPRALEGAPVVVIDDPPTSSVLPTGMSHRESLAPDTTRWGSTPTKAVTIEAMPLSPWSARPKPLGMALLAAGRIVDSQLRVALTRQSCELLYEVLRWPAGRFELRREAPSELAESARLGLPVASVVMEGFRRVDEWRLLERALGSFDAVLYRDDMAFGTLDIGSLPARERLVLDAVDGERTVRAIVSKSHQSSFDVCRILAQFLEARVLRRRIG